MNHTLSPYTLKIKDEASNELKNDLRRIKVHDNYLGEDEAQEELTKLMAWLSTTPKNIVFRVNTLLSERTGVCHRIREFFKDQFSRPPPDISTFARIEEMIVVNGWDDYIELDLTRVTNEIIVDAACGAAVLRGAHIFAPGVLGMPRGLKVGDKVSVYADLKSGCKKGLITCYDDANKLFIGNGKVNLTREQIFASHEQSVSGIAIFMTDTISRIPQLNDDILPRGHVLLQNLPSVICSRVLNPHPDEIVLDMCAAPGNKTTHIAALMENRGTLIALEKNKNKMEKLVSNVKQFSAEIVKVYCFDSTKAVSETRDKSILDGPPFPEESFDRILLDGPCSALGQRPQISNSISASQLRSYVPLQRKLFSTAVRLLKVGGTLTYSTCTITIAENEGIVSWALKTFSNLELQSVKQKLIGLGVDQFASTAYNVDGLSVEKSNKLCRFGLNDDSVGFFIACFTKK